MRDTSEHERTAAVKFGHGVVQFWGVMGVAAVLGNGARRVLPVALEPLKSRDTYPRTFWGAYIGFSCVMAYAEGYVGFHRKFSPNVVARSIALRSDNPGVTGRVLAFAYCMELFGAPAHRVRRAWSFVSAIALVVAGVKRLPHEVRIVVDAGVCTGLGVGIMSLMYHYGNFVLRGKVPPTDDDLSIQSDKSIISVCPVTTLSNAVNGLADIFVRAVRGQQAHELANADGTSQTCPISGKEGGNCPIAGLVGGVASQPASQVASQTLATGAASDAPSAFMAGKSLVASVQKNDAVSNPSLLMKLCPLNWERLTLREAAVGVLCVSLMVAAVDRKLVRKATDVSD
eukprot:TRINITY_DN903_c0_g1_i1.p1 TRINITY_DN903_c0_g1~~TRINITY_DN903_c0_g1_i1.p1  ORF type:complete len:343 (-),score=32.17 TRINITY_DN903_c0_g1_i1:229-1257(-)